MARKALEGGLQNTAAAILETAEGQSSQSVLQERSSKSETGSPKKPKCPGEDHLPRLVPLQHLQEHLHLHLHLHLRLQQPHTPLPLLQRQVGSSPHNFGFFQFDCKNRLCKTETKPFSSCTPACPCSSSSPCSSGTCSPCSARPDGPDGSHSWWSCCWLCCRPCRRQRHHRDVLWRFLRPCTCSCSSGPCTSCSCSRSKRANRTLRLGDQTVPTVQSDPVRHHQL